MNILIIFVIALCSSVIVVWFAGAIIAPALYSLFSVRLSRASVFFRDMRAREDTWPRIAGDTDDALMRFLGWARVRKYVRDKRMIYIVPSAALALAWALGGARAVPIAILLMGFAAGGFLYIVQKRRRAVVAHLPSAIETLVQAIRAGYAMQQAVGLVGRELQPPVCHIFLAIERGMNYRRPLRSILHALEWELGLKEWDLFAEALSVQERTGGNIIPLLERVAETLRQNESIEQEMRAATASGRLSGWLIALLVPVMFVLFLSLNPSYMSVFFTTGMGRLLMLLAAALEAVGFLLIRRITRISY